MDYDSSCCSEKYNNGEFYDPETKKHIKKQLSGLAVFSRKIMSILLICMSLVILSFQHGLLLQFYQTAEKRIHQCKQRAAAGSKPGSTAIF